MSNRIKSRQEARPAVKFLRTRQHDYPVPRRHTFYAAGLDLACATEESLILYPDETIRIPTGWRIAIPRGFVGLVKDRSGMALTGVTVRGGVIDWDYRGEVMVILHNESGTQRGLDAGTRIAQLVVIADPYLDAVEVSSFDEDETDRGSDGFGSTGYGI